MAFEFVGLLLRFLYPLDAHGQPTYTEGQAPQVPEVAEIARELPTHVGDRMGWVWRSVFNCVCVSVYLVCFPSILSPAFSLLGGRRSTHTHTYHPPPPLQVMEVLNKRLRKSDDQKVGDQGPRSLVALVAKSKGGFLELLHGDQGPESRKLWLNLVLVGTCLW